MRSFVLIVSILCVVVYPPSGSARSLGKCIGTFEIGTGSGAGTGSTAAFPLSTGGIRLHERHSRIHPSMDSARQETRIDQVQGWNNTVPGSLSKQYTGKGVVFGILETEFDTHHPAFLDSLGHTRFYEVWDQTDTSKPSNVSPAYGRYGQIRKSAALDADSLFATSGIYHGTLITSLGAGSDRTHPWWGVAPEATIVGVKYGYADSNITQGLKWIAAIADTLTMPCVINMSIGTQVGPHDGTSDIDRAIDSLSKAGHIIVGAAGNDGEQKPHVSFPLAPGGTRGAFATPYSSNDPAMAVNVETFIDMWGSANRTFTDTIYVCDTLTMQYSKTTTIVPNAAPKTVYWPNASTGKNDTLIFQVGSERYTYNAKPHMQILVFCNNPNLLIGVRVASALAETVHVWNANKLPFKSLGIAGFYNGDSLYTIDEIGGTAKKIITAGGYNSKVALTTWNGTVYPGDSSLHNYLSYTSLGPTADGRIKPDISAPARFVVGAMSRIGRDDNRTVWWPNPANTLGRYEFTGGTSVASPIVAGIIALMLEAYPALTPDSAKRYLQQTAITDPYTGQIATPPGDVRWGAGKVNALEAMKKVPGVSLTTGRDLALAKGSQQAFRIVVRGKDRIVLSGPATTGAIVELFDVSGRRLFSVSVPTGAAAGVAIPYSLHGCVVARVQCRGQQSVERLLSAR
jgi:minor extracellular serine protease Vpr